MKLCERGVRVITWIPVHAPVQTVGEPVGYICTRAFLIQGSSSVIFALSFVRLGH